MIKVTAFNSLFDNKTDKVMELNNFDGLEKLLYKLSEQPFASKKDSYLISPACYLSGTNRRCNENVARWSAWAAVDVDDHSFSSENLEHDLVQSFGNYRFVCYSTASSTSQYPKFRMVFPLSTTVEGDSIRHFWYALNRELGDIGDPQTKDLSRMYYIPGSYASAHNFIFSHRDGDYIDPAALMNKHRYVETRSTAKNFIDRLPDAMQKEIVKYRENSLERKPNVIWSGYRDCPFVNQNLIKDYKAIAFTDNSGRYAMIYKIMVSIASNAIRDGYPITTTEIVSLIQELDMETSQRYKKRRLDIEADRALEFAYRKM